MTATDILNIELKTGIVKIQMLPALAPKHVKQITILAKRGFYDGLFFHRVIDGFMAQGGCPRGLGTGGAPEGDIEAEFTTTPHTRGICSMARSQLPNSASSQFFIVTKDSFFLDNQYTAWGEVIDGMDYVDQIKKGTRNNGEVVDPDAMIRVWVDNPTTLNWQDTTIKVI